MPEDAYRAVGSMAEVGPLLRSKFSLYRSRGAYAAYHAAAAQGQAVQGSALYSELVIANRLVCPSYVSYETALHWYGLLPVGTGNVIKSACPMGRTRSVFCGAEEYLYIVMAKKYFAVGQAAVPHAEPLYAIATPEKALCDLVLATSWLKFRTNTGVRNYLHRTLGIPEAKLSQLSPELVESCAAVAHKKKGSLQLLAAYLRERSC